MQATTNLDKPVRIGVFNSPEEAEEAVWRLLAAGYLVEQVTVICSDPAVEARFRAFEHQDPAGTHTTAISAAGGAIGATLSGLTVIVVATAVGGVPLLVTGGIAAWAGGVFGGLVGAMLSRGIEKEAANYYQQSLQDGQILVGVETHGDTAAPSLAIAELVLAESGARPLPLAEG